MIEYLLNLPLDQYNDNPLIMINIANHQQNNPYLMQNAQVDLMHIPVKIINNVVIVCYHKQNKIPDNQWRIAIPPPMIDDIIRWYQLVLENPGSQQLYDTINARFFYLDLSTICQQSRYPDDCVMVRNQGQQHRHIIAPQEVNIAPWHTSQQQWT